MKKSSFLFFSFLLTLNTYAQLITELKLDSVFSRHILADSPGFSLGIVKNGQLVQTYHGGLANLAYSIPITDKTVFRTASLAKQFTAACIGILVLEKKLSLLDDVRKYIPELPDYGKIITIKHLLNHTSGIRNYNVLQQLKGSMDGFEMLTNEEVYELLFKQKDINHAPGEKMLYSNSNYVLLALLVERVSGKSLPEFAAQHIFLPFGMTSTFYKTSNTDIIKNGAANYYQTAKGYQQATALSIITGAGGLYSTVADLAKWSAVFTSRDSLHQALANFLTATDTLTDGSLSGYGRGVFVNAYKGNPTIHHSGMDLGLKAQMIILPQEELSLILLSNWESINAIDLCYQVLDACIKQATLQTKRSKGYVHKTKDLHKFTGDYQEINSDLTIRILLENDTLKAKNRQTRQAIPLQPTGKYAFQRISNARVTHTFNSDKGKPWDMSVDFAGATFYFEKVQLVDEASVQVKTYTGEYYSAEIGTVYSLSVEENQLCVSLPCKAKVNLIAGQKDEFGSGDRTRYVFKRNTAGEITGFTIASEGTVKDILFEKRVLCKPSTSFSK